MVTDTLAPLGVGVATVVVIPLQLDPPPELPPLPTLPPAPEPLEDAAVLPPPVPLALVVPLVVDVAVLPLVALALVLPLVALALVLPLVALALMLPLVALALMPPPIALPLVALPPVLALVALPLALEAPPDEELLVVPCPLCAASLSGLRPHPTGIDSTAMDSPAKMKHRRISVCSLNRQRGAPAR
jgi:hypothetical protein